MTSSIPTSESALDPGDLASFQEAADAIKASDGGQYIEPAIRDFDPEKRRRFLRWYAPQLARECTKQVKMKKSGLTRQGFAALIYALDISDPKTVSALNDARHSSYGPPPEPIIFFEPMRQHKYFFRYGDGVCYPKSGENGYCYKLRGPNGYHPLLRWVLYLGELWATGAHGSEVYKMQNAGVDADLQVFLNVQDKSIWLVATKGTPDVDWDPTAFWSETGLWYDERDFDLIRICKGPSLVDGRLDLQFEIEYDTAEIAGLAAYYISDDEANQLKSGKATGSNTE